MLVARLVPLLPFTAFNYFAGLTGLPWRTYAWGTVVGVVPGTAFYVAIGAVALTPGTYRTEVLVGLLPLGAAYISFRSWRGRRNQDERLDSRQGLGALGRAPPGPAARARQGMVAGLLPMRDA